jgi:hypothetical protein
MSVPSGDQFYQPRGGEQLTTLQGDIYLCPSSALISASGKDFPPGIPPTPGANDIGATFFVRAWEPPETDGDPYAAPAVVHEERWGPVMVITHECDIQKDFNALGRTLKRNEGISNEEIEDRLGERTDLDKYVVVAPVLTYEEIALQWPEELRTEDRIGDVRRGTRMDFFPMPAHPDGLLPASAVSFARMATIERKLLVNAFHVAALAEPARSVLRYKLASSFSFRDVSVVAEIEAAVGQRIERTSVTPIPQKKGEKKNVSVALYLDNGEVIHLQGAPIREVLVEGPSRPKPPING